MPEQRLQKCRDAYAGTYEKWWREANWPSFSIGATVLVPLRRNLTRPSTAYRITQAQLAAEKRKADDERV